MYWWLTSQRYYLPCWIPPLTPKLCRGFLEVVTIVKRQLKEKSHITSYAASSQHCTIIHAYMFSRPTDVYWQDTKKPFQVFPGIALSQFSTTISGPCWVCGCWHVDCWSGNLLGIDLSRRLQHRRYHRILLGLQVFASYIHEFPPTQTPTYLPLHCCHPRTTMSSQWGLIRLHREGTQEVI